MAGISKPSVIGLNPEIQITILSLNASSGSGGTTTNFSLTDGIINQTYTSSSSFYFSDSSHYFEFYLPKKANIYRAGIVGYASGYNGMLKLQRKNADNSYTDVTATYETQPLNIDNTSWDKFIKNLPRGTYRMSYLSSAHMMSEIYVERASSERAFEITTTNDVKSFNSNNVWYVTGLDKNNLTTTNYLTSGFDPYILDKPYTNIYVNMTDCGVLDVNDGGHLFLSDDIDKYLGTTSLTLIDGTNPQLQLTLPTFLPKDSLLSTDKLYFYSDEEEYTPEIMDVQFSASSTHDSIVSVTVLGRYNWNKQVQFRFKIGSSYTSPWTTTQNPYDTCSMDISPINLQLGANDITIEMMDVTDNTKIGGKTITEAITVNNNAPSIAIITADSSSFKLHFTISDNDINDTAQYQLTLMNSKGENIVVPWTTMAETPEDIYYYFDTTMVDVNKTNSLKIEYKDNYGAGGQTTYTFTGAYKNIMFIDEGGSYYTTDKGALLKLLDFGQIIGGQYSDIVAITLKNQNVQSIKNMIVNQYSITGIAGITLELSKNSNPFVPVDIIDFGEQIFATNDTINFYVRIKSLDTAQGINDFEIDVSANIVS